MTEQYFNPCGILAMPYDQRVRQKDLMDHIQAAEYKAILSLDSQEFASAADRPYNIFRAYTFEPSTEGFAATKDKTVAQVAADAAWKKLLPWAKQYPNTHIYVNNEQSFTKARLDMYAALMELSVEYGKTTGNYVGFVFGNFASGAVKCGQGNAGDNSILPTQAEIEQGKREINEWYVKAENFLRTMHKYRELKAPSGGYAFILGDHQYTTFTPWFVADGGDYVHVFDWKNRPKSLNWKRPQWHIGRTLQALMQCTKQWKITMPHYIVTESLFDTMNDVLNRDFTPKIELPSGSDKPRGFRTYVKQWPKWFPGFDTVEEAYAEMLIWTWETVYAPLGNVEATLTYSFGNTGDWWSFDVNQHDGNDDNEYMAIMEDYRWLAVPQYEEMPLPGDAGFAIRSTLTLPAGVTAMNVRAGNGVLYAVKGSVPANAILYHYNHVNVNGWTYVEYENLRGWMSMQIGGKPVVFTPVVVTEPPHSHAEIIQSLADALAQLAHVKADVEQLTIKVGKAKTDLENLDDE